MLRSKPASILRAITLAGALCALAFALPAAASAGSYTIQECQASAWHSFYGWRSTATAGSSGGIGYFWGPSVDCGSYGAYARFEINTVPGGAAFDWTFTAPLDTTIERFDFAGYGTPSVAGAYDAVFAYSPAGRQTLAIATPSLTWNGQAASSSLGNASYSPASGTTQLQLEMGCSASSCPGVNSGGGYSNVLDYGGGSITLSDAYVPTFTSISGSGWSDAPGDGVNSIDYQAADRGAGISKVHFYVDGVEQVAQLRANNCYYDDRVVPCALTSSNRFTLDTTRLVEGTHTIALSVEDGAGNATPRSANQKTITIRRKPGLVAPAASDAPGTNSNGPSVGGYGSELTQGEQVTGSRGTWTGSDITYAYQWKRCDANGLACVDVPGATGLTYTTTAQDVGHKLVFCVTASSTGGTTTECSAPSALVEADSDRDGVPDAVDRCPSVAAPGHAEGCPTTSTGTSADPATTSDLPGSAVPVSRGTTGPGGAAGAGAAGAPNGSGGGVGSKLSVFVSGKYRTQKVRFGKRVSLTGRLTGPDGTPVAEAVIDVGVRVAKAGASLVGTTRVVSGRDGRFSWVAPAGPSRTIRFGYRASLGETTFVDTTDVNLLVSAGVTMKATPVRVHNRHATVFTGRLLGGPVPRRGVVIDLQVFFRKQWRTFAAPRTNRRGVYRFKYRFMAGAATWRFRARVRRDSSYPFELGTSMRSVRVRVV